MSFDIWVSAFRDGQITTFPRTIVEEAFDQFVSKKSPEWWDLSFPDGGDGVLEMDDTPLVDNFSVNRPPGSPLFWQVVVEVLKKTPTVLYWPGGGCVVADPSVIPSLPEDFIKGMGVPVVTTDIAEILDLIRKTA